MNHPVVKIAGDHADECPGGILPVILTGSEGHGTILIGHVGPDFDHAPGSVHDDRNRGITHAMAQTYRPLQPRHQLATM
ncbi:MAG TPA: hypothetical protein VGG44_06425 [Tepidisphaeraceae bacterium]